MRGLVEQIGSPQEIYDRPASMFVADFIGSPPMNFLHFEGGLQPGDETVRLHGASIAVPGDPRARARWVRWCSACVPSTSASPTPRRCAAACSAPSISAPPRSSPSIPARGASRRACRRACRCEIGETVGLAFRSERLSLFDATERRGDPRRQAMRSAAMADVDAATRQQAFRHDVEAGARPVACHQRRRVRRAAGPERRRQDDDACGSIAGLERPDDGAIRSTAATSTRDPPGSRDIAFVFQQYSLYPHLTVYDNLAFPLRSPVRRVPEAGRSASASSRRRSCCTSPASSATARRGFPAARCSGSRSAARWCAIPRSI